MAVSLVDYKVHSTEDVEVMAVVGMLLAVATSLTRVRTSRQV